MDRILFLFSAANDQNSTITASRASSSSSCDHLQQWKTKLLFLWTSLVWNLLYLLLPVEVLFIHLHRSKVPGSRAVSLFKSLWQMLYIKARSGFSVFSAYSSLVFTRWKTCYCRVFVHKPSELCEVGRIRTFLYAPDAWKSSPQCLSGDKLFMAILLSIIFER